MAVVRVIGVAAVMVMLFVGVAALYRSAVFKVEEVNVAGVSVLTVEEVRAAAAVPDDATLLRFPGSEVEERLRENPWISDVSVRRGFPNAMIIEVEERVPAAFVDVGEATLLLVDSHGFIIDSRTPSQGDALVVIRDLEDFAPTVGEIADSPSLRNALAVLAGISDELRSSVRAASAPSIDRTSLITVDDVEVLVGSADDIEMKDSIARRILSEQAGRAVYVNVRTPDRPTWRGLEDTP